MMKKIPILGLTFLELALTTSLCASQAQALEVTRAPSGKLVLNGATCDEVNRQLLQLEKWTHPTSGGRCSSPNASDTASGCSAEITQCVPQHVQDYHGVHPLHEGPNCFNLVMVNTGVMPYLVETSAEEMAYYKKSPLCRKLGAREQKKPGDVGSILSGTGELHGFIYVTDKLAYSKNGLDPKEPYQLTSLQEISDLYGVGQRETDRNDSECYKSKEPECLVRIRTDYYRCKSMDEYLREDAPKPLQRNIAHATHLFDQIDCRISRALFDNAGVTTVANQEMESIGEALTTYIQTEISSNLKSNRLTPEDLFALGMLKLRINNLYYNLSQSPIPGAGKNDWSSTLSQTVESVLPETGN
jgi:hypothetical protein